MLLPIRQEGLLMTRWERQGGEKRMGCLILNLLLPAGDWVSVDTDIKAALLKHEVEPGQNGRSRRRGGEVQTVSNTRVIL